MTDAPPPAPTETTCYRHPDRSAGVRCQRCDRYICPSCMNTASVGFHCPECFSEGRQKIHSGGYLFNRRPLVTQALIAINVLAFVFSIATGDGIGGSVKVDGVLWNGALNAGAVSVGGDWYRIITSGFLHYGVIHIGFNMYVLWAYGPQFERSIGSVRFLLVYMMAMMTGSLGAMLVSPNALTAGASGAIFGLFGLAVISQRSMGRSIWDNGLGAVLLLNFLLTFGSSRISTGGHVGGFLGGLAAGWLVYELSRRVKLPKYSIETILALVAVGCFVATLVAADAAVDF